MVLASQLMSLEEFLTLDDGTDTWYELENGKLRAILPESDRNPTFSRLASRVDNIFCTLRPEKTKSIAVYH